MFEVSGVGNRLGVGVIIGRCWMRRGIVGGGKNDGVRGWDGMN